jgi:hypothetical protein
MVRLAKLQLIGPIVLALAIGAEELATVLLAWKPSSAFAWYLNLELFGIFQHSHSMLSGHFDLPYLQLMLVAAPILAMALVGQALHARLPVAIAANLSFAYAFFLAYSWYSIRMPASQAASLDGSVFGQSFSMTGLNLTFGPHVCVLAALLIPSLLSSTASHLTYLRAMRGV